MWETSGLSVGAETVVTDKFKESITKELTF